MNATAIHIWAATDLKPAKVSSITGDVELLLGLDSVGGVDSEVDFGRRNFQVVQGAWRAIARNNKNRRVSLLVATSRGRTKLEGISRKGKSRN